MNKLDDKLTVYLIIFFVFIIISVLIIIFGG